MNMNFITRTHSGHYVGYRWIIWVGVLLTLFIIALCFTGGCNEAIKKPYDEPNKPVIELTHEEIVTTFDYKDAAAELQAKIDTLKYVSWFQKLALIGIAGSIFACFIGLAKWGVPALVTCLLCFGIGTALNEYWELIGFVCLGLGVVVCGVAIYVHRREFFATKTALKEVVVGVEAAKTTTDIKNLIVDNQKAAQSAATTSLVDRIREAL